MVETTETKAETDKIEEHQPREREVRCFCGRGTWNWNAICDVCKKR